MIRKKKLSLYKILPARTSSGNEPRLLLLSKVMSARSTPPELRREKCFSLRLDFPFKLTCRDNTRSDKIEGADSRRNIFQLEIGNCTINVSVSDFSSGFVNVSILCLKKCYLKARYYSQKRKTFRD